MAQNNIEAAGPLTFQPLKIVTEHEARQLFKIKHDCRKEFQKRLPQYVNPSSGKNICHNCEREPLNLGPADGHCPFCGETINIVEIVKRQHECSYPQALNRLAVEQNLVIAPQRDRAGGQVDFQEAWRFIWAIAGDGPLTFQTFDDTAKDDEEKDRKLERILQGSFLEHANYLAYLNRKGAGVYLTINEILKKGRSNNNVTKIRAVWVDLDGSPIEPVRDCPVRPHIIVESSPDRYHAYWLTDDVPLKKFGAIQTALMRKFNGDPCVKDLCRVMRLPGFFHNKNKDNPYLTKILELAQ